MSGSTAAASRPNRASVMCGRNARASTGRPSSIIRERTSQSSFTNRRHRQGRHGQAWMRRTRPMFDARHRRRCQRQAMRGQSLCQSAAQFDAQRANERHRQMQLVVEYPARARWNSGQRLSASRVATSGANAIKQRCHPSISGESVDRIVGHRPWLKQPAPATVSRAPISYTDLVAACSRCPVGEMAMACRRTIHTRNIIPPLYAFGQLKSRVALAGARLPVLPCRLHLVLQKVAVPRHPRGTGRRLQRGSSDCPIRNASTERAHWRPSRIAHTTSDWPRRMSPAVNTLSTDV